MSFTDDARPQDTGPERLNPAQRAPTLDASVEATGGASDLCTGQGPASPGAARARILVWLAEGSREVTWALCSLPRERWAEAPPSRLSNWPALRHVRHLALRQRHLTLPLVRRALGEADCEAEPSRSTLEFEQADAAWDPPSASDSADSIVEGFGETRFELLQRFEAAPDDAQQHLEWLLLDARQHELEHLAAVWRIALHWDRVTHTSVPNVPLHPADRLEESH